MIGKKEASNWSLELRLVSNRQQICIYLSYSCNICERNSIDNISNDEPTINFNIE